MYRSATTLPTIDQRKTRQKLAALYIGTLATTVVVMVMRVLFVGEISQSTWNAVTIAALLVGPLFIATAYLFVDKSFRRVIAATSSPDVAAKEAAVIEGLALPMRATFAYLTAWAIGQPLALVIASRLTSISEAETLAYMTQFIGFVPVAGFPIYAIVESQMRPIIRVLYAQAGDQMSNDRVLQRRFSISLRVSLAMGSLVFAMVMLLGGGVISNAIGADVSYENVLSELVVQIPIFVLMTAMVGSAVVVSLRGSINELVGSIRSAAEGDLTGRTAVTATDELGAAMVDLDRMVHTQASLISSSAEVAREVTLSAGAVADGSEQSAIGVGEIARSMQEVVSGAQIQFDQVSLARNATEDLKQALSRAEEEATEAAHASAGAQDLAHEGSSSATNAREAMDSIQVQIAEATAAVERLGGDTAGIGSIVETIVTIADQTNLLALNAAIEAARAGEQGRGFAVVAEEVRKLANESSDAAAEIAALIKRIERTVVDTVKAVGMGSAEVERGVIVVDEAGRQFTTIAGSLSQIDSHVQEIGARTRDVDHATEAVTSAVEAILAVTESVAALAEQTSASTQEASASSEEITSSADVLRSTASNLETQIAAFKF
ncbi:MAG: methyl-accepting chemotaxis protein [Solirubrobacterales bacterium]